MYEPRPVHFDRPPVVEVALALQTPPVAGLTSAHFGLFWDQELRTSYPRVQEQPAAPSFVDSPGVPISVPQVVFGPMMAGTRHWYLSPDETRIVQLQQDRIIVNWRKLATQVYPRFESLRADLEMHAGAWWSYLESAGFEQPMAAQVEVTYVNQIPSVDSAGQHVALADVLRVPQLSWPDLVGTPESTQLVQQFLVTDGDNPIGRLHLQLGADNNAGDGQAYSLNFTYRGIAGASLEASLARLDAGHNQIVNTFRDITTPSMHSYWGEGSE